MRLKELQSELEGLRVFDSPKVLLEQYPTTPHLAAQMLFAAETTYGDIEGRTVLDLGCGCGVLAIASCLLGASFVLGVDVDDDALRIARSNLEDMQMLAEVDLLQATVSAPSTGPCALDRLELHFETVVMNPPFGTKTAGLDMVFLERALKIASCAVYSLHKSSTRDHIRRRAKASGFTGEVLAKMHFDLPKTMRFHKQDLKFVEVDLWRFAKEVG